MTECYDAVIAGAGPAGGQCARDLARRGYDVLVLEAEHEDAFPSASNKSTGGTFPRMFSAFGIPDDVVMHYTDHVILESPNEHLIQHEPGAVLDFADFKRYLVRDGRERGAEFRFDARVTAPVLEDGAIVGVQYRGDREVRGDVVIDATGPAAVLATHLGTSDLERQRLAIGVEYEMDGLVLDHSGYPDLTDAMLIHLDRELAPGGYAWIFHTGAATAKVGLCYIWNDARRASDRDLGTIEDALLHWTETDPRLQTAERIARKQHRGSAHIQMPGELVADNFIAIGDTVPTVDPIFGEGIHACMTSGRAAATAVDRCLITSRRDTSAASLSTYTDLWHRDVAPNRRGRLLISRVLYQASNERYDTFVRDLRNGNATLSEETADDPAKLLNLLHLGDVSLLAGVAGELLAKRFRKLLENSSYAGSRADGR